MLPPGLSSRNARLYKGIKSVRVLVRGISKGASVRASVKGNRGVKRASVKGNRGISSYM